MADEQIVTNIVARSDFSGLIADVQRTTAALAKLQQELSITNKTLAAQAGQIQKSFSETLRSTGQFSSHFVTVGSQVESFGRSLDGGKLKLKDYFRTWQEHTRTSGGLIRDLARQQVSLQNAIVQPLGRTADGLMKFNVQVPKGLDAVANKTAIAKKELQIYNKVIQDGGVQLINWGKNTQWAGRQLTVGLTVPLAAFGMAAAKAFREADQELVRLTKVYGGVAATSAVDLANVRKDVSQTARELAAAYGSSFKDTISLAADIAATGKTGNELLVSTKETTRLAVLGEVDRQDAMKATLALQNAFKQSTTELSESINFLNAVENQTSTSLGDLIEAIPKAGPVVQSLGGDVKDLALYLTAMKEGGINASEGANALKSALASMINPTKVAREMFSGLGIDLGGIVTQNAGNLTATITALQSSLDKLNPLQKSQAIEQLFGKFQFARLSALFENLGKEGSQTLQVMDLMKASSADLANVAGRELSQITESASGKYQRALQTLKADLAGVGESFLNVQTFFLNLTSSVVKFIEMLPGPVKSMLTLVAGITALAGPIIMLTGVFANFIGYVIKGIGHLKALFRGGEGFKLLTPEILAASKAGSLVEKTFYSDAAAADILSASLKNLITEFTILQQKAASGAISVQPTIATLAGTVAMAGTPGGMYKGVTVDPNNPLVGRMGTRASAHMNPVGNMTEAERAAQTIFGMVPGPIPVNRKIGRNPQMYADHGLPAIPGLTTIGGVSTGVIPEEAAKWHAMTGAIAMQSEAEIALLKKEVAATGTVTHELSGSYQALLPEITRLTKLAAQEGAAIVAQTQAGAITVEQARAKIVALNARVEAMIAETTTQIAITQGRTANLTMVPFTNQPVVDPKTGKSNMKEMFHKTPTATLVDNVARALGGIRTSGGGFSTETTIRRNQGGPIYRNQGGPIYYNDGSRSVVPGPNVNADVVPAMLTPGEFVVNKKATQANLGLLQSINSGKLGGSVSSSQGGYGVRPSALDISRMFNGLFSKAKSRSTVKVRGNALPRHFWSTATGQDTNSRRMDLVESLNAGRPIRNRKGKDYTEEELRLLPKEEVNTIWKGIDRSHFAPAATIGRDGQYISPGLFGPQKRGGAGGNLSLNQGGNPQDILNSLMDTPIHPFSTMRSASRLLGYPSKDINASFNAAWLELTAALKIRTTAFGKDQDTFEEFAGKILKKHLKHLKVPDTSINFYDEMHRLGTVRGAGIKGSGASVVANDPDITFNIPQRRMGGPVSGASPYIVGENGPELFVPQNSGKIIPGFNKGGQIQNFAKGGEVMAMLMRMIPGLAGYGIGSKLTGGSMMGGMLGSLGGDLIGTALAGKILKLGEAATKTGKSVSLLQKGLQFLKAKPVFGWTAAVLAGAAIIKSVNDKINEHRRVINLAFAQNSETASKLGINYKSLNEQLKDFKDKMDLARASANAFYNSTTMTNGLKLTIQQFQELKESVKKDLPDLISVFDKAGGNEVVQKASQLKAQFISGGMSAEKATSVIYALIANSNKAYLSLQVLADQGFGSIIDKSTAAISSVETFNALLNEGNTDQLAPAFQSLITSVQEMEKSLIGTEDETGKIITASRAWEITMQKITAAQGSSASLTSFQYSELQKTVPELYKILNGTESTAAVLAKWKVYISGARVELKGMTEDAAIALAAAQTNLVGILSGGKTGTDIDKIVDAINRANKASLTNKTLIQKNAVSAQDALKAEIELHQDNIDKIKEEADARRKSLSRQSEDEDILTQIKKKQLEYQDALAMGDSATAAQAQLDLQMLQRGQEKTLALRAIDDKEKADTAAQQSIIDSLQKKLDGTSKTLQTQLDNADKALSKVTDLQNFLNEVVSFISSSGTIDTDDELKAANLLQKKGEDLGLKDIKLGAIKQDPAAALFASKFGTGMASLGFPTYNPYAAGTDIILQKVIKEGRLSVEDKNSLSNNNLLKGILSAVSTNRNQIAPIDLGQTGSGQYAQNFITAKVLAKYGISPNTKTGSYLNETIQVGGQSYQISGFDKASGRYSLRKLAMGGPIKHYEPGGNVRGPGTGISDSIPAMLSNGEYVIKANSVKKYGTETFDALNAGKFADGALIGYHKGGPVGHKHGPAEAARLKELRLAKPSAVQSPKKWYAGFQALTKRENWGFGKTHGVVDLPYDAYKNIIFPTVAWADRMVGDTIGGALNIKSPLITSTNRNARAQMSNKDIAIQQAVDLLGILPYGKIVSKLSTAGMSKATIAKIAEEKLTSKAATAAYRASVKPVPLPYKALNTFNQYANYFKAKKLVKEKQYHGSSDRGNSFDRPLYGESVLDGTPAYDPHYGMGFYSTSSKAEADLYAGGYNVPGQWGESYGSMNQVTRIPFGKYIDYRKSNIKSQNYLLWKLLQGKDYRYAGEDLGSLMNQAGTTGSIMKRISNGRTGDATIDKATWLALNKPKGTTLQETGLGFSPSNLGFQESGFTYNNWSTKTVQEFLRKNLGKTGLTQDRSIINEVLSKTPIRKVPKTTLEDLHALGATTYTSTGNHISLPSKTTFGTTIHEGAHALDAFTGTSVRRFIGEVGRTKSKVDADRLSRLWISSQTTLNPLHTFINKVQGARLHPNLLTGIQEATATDAHSFAYKNAGFNLIKKLRIGNPYTAGQGYIESFEQLLQYSHGVQSMQGKIDLANGLLTSERMSSSLRKQMQQWVRRLENEKASGMSYPGFEEFGKPGNIGRIESLRPNTSSSPNANSMFTPPELRTVEDYIGRPRTYADSMAHVLDRFNFGDQAGTFFRGLSMHDMAAIAGYTRVPNPNLIYGRDYMEKWGPTSWGGFADDTAEAPWAHLARSWKPEAASVFPRGTRSPLPSTEEAMPYLNMLPGLKIGEYWRPDTLKSITAELEFAKHIAVSGGTGGGETKAIAKIIVDPKVKGVGDFAKFSPPKPKPNWMGTEFTEGAIAPFTKYILQAINKNAHSLTDESKGVSHLIDEYVFKAVETSPYLEFLKRQMSIKTEGLLPIVKKATGGYVNPSYSPSMSVPQFKDGINMVPADMLAMIHKNEAIVPANMNPFNPNANNATMAPAVYNISMTNHASEGMDINAFSDIATRKVLAEIKRLDVQRASMNGIGRRV